MLVEVKKNTTDMYKTTNPADAGLVVKVKKESVYSNINFEVRLVADDLMLMMYMPFASELTSTACVPDGELSASVVV